MLWLCVCILALLIWLANHILSVPHSILICGLSDATIFFHTISLKAQFLEKKNIGYKFDIRWIQIVFRFTLQFLVEEIQQNVTVCRYLFTAKVLYMFRVFITQSSSGVHKTVVAASGTDHTIWGTCFFKRSCGTDHTIWGAIFFKRGSGTYHTTWGAIFFKRGSGTDHTTWGASFLKCGHVRRSMLPK